MEPLANKTLDFTETIAGMYLDKMDHRSIAFHQINHFFEFLRSEYLVNTGKRDQQFLDKVSLKSGNSEEDTINLFQFIEDILSSGNVSKEILLELNSKIEQFNEQLDYNRNQFNTQNSLAIEQSNVQWRRNLNTANTAGVNAVNQANAMNAFNLSNQGLSFLWQEMRDAAKWEYEAAQNSEDRASVLAQAALGNEAASDAVKSNNLKTLGQWAIDIWKTI